MAIFINENLFLNEEVNRYDIQTAINERKVCQIRYSNTGGNRKIHPYLYGTLNNGKTALRAYQESGSTQTRNRDWKIFLISEILSFTVLDEEFTPDNPKYNPNDKMFSEVFVSI